MVGSSDNIEPTPVVLGWQASLSTIKERISHIYGNDALADVYFIVGLGEHRQRIPAHKLVLSVSSAVFDAMFNSRLSVRSNDALEVQVTDVEPAAFHNLLRFIYRDEIDFAFENMIATLYAAKKYGVHALEKVCVNALRNGLRPENVLVFLAQARLLDEASFAHHCLNYIDKHAGDVFTSGSFLDADVTMLSEILHRDTLRIKETEVFAALCRWSAAECERKGNTSPTAVQKRNVLGPLFLLVRIPAMDSGQFARGPSQSGMFSEAECSSIFKYFHTKSELVLPFNHSPRRALHEGDTVVSRFKRNSVHSMVFSHGNVPDSIMFTVNRRIFITGFGLHGVARKCDCEVSLQIQENPFKVLMSHVTSIKCDGLSTVYKVSLPYPVEIRSNVKYIASCLGKGYEGWWCCKGGASRVEQPLGSPVFTFADVPYAHNETTVEKGQFPEIYYYTDD